ncbi:hypothetical protein ACGLFO_10695, partial [Corynebacterium hesseae]
ALLMGLSVFIASTMEWTAGFGFSAGFVDMLLSSQNPLANKWYMLLVMGVGWGRCSGSEKPSWALWRCCPSRRSSVVLATGSPARLARITSPPSC